MIYPVPFLPSWVTETAESFVASVRNSALSYHTNMVLLTIVFYQITQTYLSPFFSSCLFPSTYPSLSRKTKIKWDVNVVSLIQGCLINTLALWVRTIDRERAEMNTWERVYGYTGTTGIVHAIAAGYFIWDFAVMSRHLEIFGIGLLIHAIGSLWVILFAFVSVYAFDSRQFDGSSTNAGFRQKRPFLSFYVPVVVVYELWTPFLSIHWFCDKLHLTGSPLQLYNGVALLILWCWGLFWCSNQCAQALQDAISTLSSNGSEPAEWTTSSIKSVFESALFWPPQMLADSWKSTQKAEVAQSFGPSKTPVAPWVVLTYAVSAGVLNLLNLYWLITMFLALAKRFRKMERVPNRSAATSLGQLLVPGSGDRASKEKKL